MVESQPSKLLVAGSIPVSRSILRQALAALTASDGEPGSRQALAALAARMAGQGVGGRSLSVWPQADVSAGAASGAAGSVEADLSAEAASGASV